MFAKQNVCYTVIVELSSVLAHVFKDIRMSKSKEPARDAVELELSKSQQLAVDNWAASTFVSKQIAELVDKDKQTLVEEVLPSWLALWKKSKEVPSNPRLTTLVASCVFVVKLAFKVMLTKSTPTPKDALLAAGLSEDRAEVFAAYVKKNKRKELIGSFDDMMSSENKETKAAAKSLFAAIQANPLWKALLKDKEEYVVKEDLVADIINVSKSQAEIIKVFKVLQPSVYPFNGQHQDALSAIKVRLGKSEAESQASKKAV